MEKFFSSLSKRNMNEMIQWMNHLFTHINSITGYKDKKEKDCFLVSLTELGCTILDSTKNQEFHDQVDHSVTVILSRAKKSPSFVCSRFNSLLEADPTTILIFLLLSDGNWCNCRVACLFGHLWKKLGVYWFLFICLLYLTEHLDSHNPNPLDYIPSGYYDLGQYVMEAAFSL